MKGAPLSDSVPLGKKCNTSGVITSVSSRSSGQVNTPLFGRNRDSSSLASAHSRLVRLPSGTVDVDIAHDFFGSYSDVASGISRRRQDERLVNSPSGEVMAA
jgi:hypothetical protein